MTEDDGPWVLTGGMWVDGATSVLICEALRVTFLELRRNADRPHPRLLALAKAADTVARQWNAEVAEHLNSVSGTPGIPQLEDAASIGLVRSADVARVLGISTRAVRGLAHRGTLPGYKDGTGWRFVLADVVQLADQREERRNQSAGGDGKPSADGRVEVLEVLVDVLGLLAVGGDVAADGGEAGGSLVAAELAADLGLELDHA